MTKTVNQKIQDYFNKNHNTLFNFDYSDKIDVNKLIFDLFENELKGDVKTKKRDIRKQKSNYLTPLKQNSDVTNKDELTDVNNLETLVNNQNIKNIMDLLQKQQLEIDSIKELLKQKSDVKDSEAPQDKELNTILNKIKRFDMTSNDRQTFYVTDVNSQLINDFYKTNQINKSSLLNFIISSWFENNVKER